MKHCGDIVTLKILCSIRNHHGVTALHLLLGESVCSYLILSTIVSMLSEENESDNSTSLPHPLLLSDNDSELPIHYACEAGSHPDYLKLILGVNEDNFNYLLSKSTFHVSDVQCKLPVDCLLCWFIDEFDEEIANFLQLDSIEDVGFDSYTMYLNNQENIEQNRFEDIREIVEVELWPRVQVLLQAGILSNMHIGNNDQTSHFTILSQLHYPVHLAASVPNFPPFVLKTAQMLTKAGSLLETNEDGRIPLHCAASVSVKPIGLNFCPTLNVPFIPIEHQWHSKHEPKSMIQYLLQQEDTSASVMNRDGRLALHLAIHSGQDYETGIKPILEAYTQALTVPDPVTMLYPFMLAALKECACIDVIFHLLLVDPSLCRKNA
mmetsp:Transcript_6871/g.8678  ORF Transcript_6871/g.8678 Transcript_6871/m.8678 type:complete len:378 (+) Transcript_6871:444-1577(+)